MRSIRAGLDNLWRRWNRYRPSKSLWLFSCLGVVIATMAIGFLAGGWTTVDRARGKAAEAAERARTRLVAEVCVHRYIRADGFASRFAELKDAVTFKREDLIEEGPWTDLPGVEEPVANAARLCANELAAMAVPNNPASDNEADPGLAR